MTTVIANMSMSLGGSIEDRDGDADRHLFRWTTSGRQRSTMPGDGRELRTSSATARRLQEAMSQVGSLVCGRRLFDVTHGWGGRHPAGVPVIVVTHAPPGDWGHGDAPFTFVTDGVQRAVELAEAQAGGKTVAVASPSIARQCLDLGLLDAVAVDLVPVLLGAGTPWSTGIAEVTELEDPISTPGEGVKHLLYRIERG